jgi:Protein of unknown function (DUF3455)
MHIKYVFSTLFLFLSVQLNAADNAVDLMKMPADSSLIKTVHAKGEQIYLCKSESGTYVWKWQAPNAELFDVESQAHVGTHGAGPSWKYNDGSSVKAKMIQKIDSPDKGSVPWLLLEATEHGGQGLLTQTRYILRINTQGGIQPTSGCDMNHLGAEAKVVYSADYSFYGQ